MKKIICMTLTLSVFGAGLFAKTWTNNAGVGITFPNSMVCVDEKGADDIYQHKFGFEGVYIGVHETGFTVKGGFDTGVTASKNVEIQDFNTNIGFYENINLGAGYSFVNTDTTLFGITAMIGLNADIYPHFNAYDVSGVRHEKTDTLTLITAEAGLDLFVRHNIGNNFGFYAGIGGRYVVGGVSFFQSKDEYEEAGEDKETVHDEKKLLIGNFNVKPSVGFIWKF